MFTQLLNSQVSYKRSDQWNSRSPGQLTQQCNADTYVRTHVPHMTHASVIVNSNNVPTLFSRQSLGNRIAVLDICTQWYLPGTAAGGGGGGGWLHWKLQVWQIWLPVWASDWRWSKPPIRSYTLVTISSGKHFFDNTEMCGKGQPRLFSNLNEFVQFSKSLPNICLPTSSHYRDILSSRLPGCFCQEN